MQWLLDNWIWILLGGGMIVMHLFGHGNHSSHGKHRADRNGAPGAKPEVEPGTGTGSNTGPNQNSIQKTDYDGRNSENETAAH